MLAASRFSSRVLCSTIPRRLVHSSPPRSSYSPLAPLSRRGIWVAGLGIAGGACLFLRPKVHTDADIEYAPRYKEQTPLSALLRSYVVYSLCSVPAVVDYSPTILSFLVSIPGVSLITKAVVRLTFFAQFVGGDTAQDTVPLLTQLRYQKKGVLLGYGVEVDQREAALKSQGPSGINSSARHKETVDEIIKCIDVAADFEEAQNADGTSILARKTWVAVKITALVPSAHCLMSFSDHIRKTRPELSPAVPFPGCPHPSDFAFMESGAQIPQGLTHEDVVALKELYDDLHRIAERGAQRGVRVIIDAEHSWYQPAIDAFTLSLMRRFNKLTSENAENEGELPAVQPLVYGTYQAYLKRTQNHLLQSIQDAKAGGYALGVKLVRGAYHPYEVGASASEEACPVWPQKKDTDACFNGCIALLLSALRDDLAHAVPRLGIFFGTHNSQSCDRILEGLVREGIAEEHGGVVRLDEAVTARCAIGQLFGMSDDLTNRLVNRTKSLSPFLIKYVPYGPLDAIIPYLCRRAIENKSVLFGERGASAERRRTGAEIRRRLLALLRLPNF